MDPCIRALFKDVSRSAVLSRDEEVELWRRKKAGDKEAVDLLGRAMLRLAVRIAGYYIKSGVDYRDLLCLALEGVAKGVHAFDPARGRLTSVVTTYIRAVILEYLNTSRFAVRVARPVKGQSSDTAEAMHRVKKGVASLSITKIPADWQYKTEMPGDQLRIEDLLPTLLAELTPKQRIVIKRRLQGDRLVTIARDHGVSTQAVQRLFADAVKRMRRSLQAKGIDHADFCAAER